MTFLVLLYPVCAFAEGAHRFFDCSITLSCDAQGQCEPARDTLTFHLEPLNVNVDGSGSYIIRYQGLEVQAQALSEAGPFYWTIEDRLSSERHTLLASSETEFLWHQLKLRSELATSINYLQCELRF